MDKTAIKRACEAIISVFLLAIIPAKAQMYESFYLQNVFGPNSVNVDAPSISEEAGRGEHRLLIHYRKQYLDDAALDYYLSGAGWGTVKSIGRLAAFYYLDYTSKREFAATIDPMCAEERGVFAGETDEFGCEYAVWAQGQLEYNHLSYEEEMLLLLLAEIKYDQEYSRYVDNLGKFQRELTLYKSGDIDTAPRAPRMNYERSINNLDLVIAGYPGTPAALYARYFLGCIYSDLGENASAKRNFDNILGRKDTNDYFDGSALRMANIALDEEQYETAERYLEMVAGDSHFITDALYGLAYVNYVLAGIENDRERDKDVLSLFGELYSVSENELITEYCGNLAGAALLALGGYTETPASDAVNSLIDEYATYIGDEDAETYLVSEIAGATECIYKGAEK